MSLLLLPALLAPLAQDDGPTHPVDLARVAPFNVVFILADDLGWRDTTLYDAPGTTRLYETPNLERLAKSGMVFTHAYAASSVCTPTRASLMTGLSPARTGLTLPSGNHPEELLAPRPTEKAPPGYELLVPMPATRLAPSYRTLAEALREAGFDTAHFGKWHLGPEPYSPREHGFELDVPHWPGAGPAGGYLAPWEFPGYPAGEPGEEIDERLAREAVAYMAEHRGSPFFLQFWPFGVHVPHEAKPELVERFRAKLGRLAADDPRRSPTYAAMVASLDASVGILLDGLERLGLAERTIVVFLSDNGGDDMDRIDGVPATSNLPLRSGKGSIFDGGLRVPCVVRWPSVVALGSRSDEVIQSTDFYPTLLEMLGLAPAEGQRFDGRSLVPALRGQPLAREAIFTFQPQYGDSSEPLPPCVAVHAGGWKLIRVFRGGEGDADRRLLFDLGADPGERNDVAAREPERVRAMDALVDKWLAETGALLPVPNPRFDPAQQPADGGRPETRERASAAELQGWTVRLGDAVVREGVLVLEGHGQETFLVRKLEAPAGTATLALRVRCPAGGAGSVERVGGSSVAFTLAGGAWQELEVALGADPLGTLRLHLPAKEQPVELDWIELRVAAAPQRWDF